MRHVVIDSAPSGWRLEPIADTCIEAARDLPGRFPNAGLRNLVCIRASEADHQADPSGRTRIWLAYEGSQVTGSFKVRGALCALDAARRAGERHVVAASAGNHGAGVAHAARTLGMRATIVVPASTPSVKLRRMAGEGIDVLQVDGGYDEAEKAARKLAARAGSVFVSPYDDDAVLAGNGASLAFELVHELGRVPDRVVTPIGGGGLAAGLASGLAAVESRPATTRPVWTVQSEISPAFALSVVGGTVMEHLEAAGPTLAEGLEGGISARSAGRVASLVAGVTVVSERAISVAMRELDRVYGLRVEGSGAVAMVPVLQGLPTWWPSGDIVVVLTGGNVDEEVVGAVVGTGGRC